HGRIRRRQRAVPRVRPPNVCRTGRRRRCLLMFATPRSDAGDPRPAIHVPPVSVRRRGRQNPPTKPTVSRPRGVSGNDRPKVTERTCMNLRLGRRGKSEVGAIGVLDPRSERNHYVGYGIELSRSRRRKTGPGDLRKMPQRVPEQPAKHRMDVEPYSRPGAWAEQVQSKEIKLSSFVLSDAGSLFV